VLGDKRIHWRDYAVAAHDAEQGIEENALAIASWSMEEQQGVFLDGPCEGVSGPLLEVGASETEDNRQWAEIRINQLTGGDPITARFLRQEFFTFIPQFKPLFIGNHQPQLRNVNDAAKRRFNMAPFKHKPAIPDKDLEEKLRPERPAILRWAINGCLDWQKNGLLRPPVVTNSTAEYFADQDLLGQWMDECCEIDPGKADTIARLWGSWDTFAQNRGERFNSSKGFSNALLSKCPQLSRCKDEYQIRGRGIHGIYCRTTRPRKT
jgi:P4 family phage/plasmid primase-like protien